MGKKIVIYLRNGNRAVTITDHNEKRSIKELRGIFEELLQMDRLIRITTSTDGLLLKPSDVCGIHIQESAGSSTKPVMDELNSVDLSFDEVDDGEYRNVAPPQRKSESKEPKVKIEDFTELPDISVSDEIIAKELEIEEQDEINTEKEDGIPEKEKEGIPNIEDINISDILEESVHEVKNETKPTIIEPEVPKPVQTKQAAILVPKSKPTIKTDRPTSAVSQNVSIGPAHEEVTDPKTIMTHPQAINSVPDMGKNLGHIFENDGKPIMRSGAGGVMKDPKIEEVQRRAAQKGMNIKAVPLTKK